MDREDHWQIACAFANSLQHCGKSVFAVDIIRPMQREHDVLLLDKTKFIPERWRLQARHICKQCVNHRIADEEDSVVGNSRSAQVRIGDFTCRKKVIRDRIRHHSIDLFGHRPITRTNAAFDMRHRHAKFLRCDRARHRRGDVSHDKAKFTSFFQQQLLVTSHDGCCLLRLRSRTNFEIEMRCWNTKLREKITRHLGVIMLSGMD